MSIQLLGQKSDLMMSNFGWRKMLHVALRYGWQPGGAKKSDSATPATEKGFDEGNWQYPLHPTRGIPPGHPLAYCSDVLLYCNSSILGEYVAGCRVSQSDAQALASALENAVPHMPEGAASFRDHKPGALFNPNEWFEPQSRELFRKVIAFCKEGGFTVEA